MSNVINELRNYNAVPRELVFDTSLSDRAKFVYIFMACKPEDWQFFLEPMAKDIGYSVDTLRKYINELVASGWLIKGEQQTRNGAFSAVKYTLKATKFSDTEKVRHGKNTVQYNSIVNNIDCNIKDIDIKEKNKEKELKEKSDALFEECYLAYRRKCESKKKAKDYWNKLTETEKDMVLPHVKAYVSTREIQFQQAFERYLRDKTFLSVVFKNSSVVYDPTIGATNEYRPMTDGDLRWNDYYDCYIYIGMFVEELQDGYTDDTRPEGARIMLNNGRGFIVWNSSARQWDKE